MHLILGDGWGSLQQVNFSKKMKKGWTVKLQNLVFEQTFSINQPLSTVTFKITIQNKTQLSICNKENIKYLKILQTELCKSKSKHICIMYLAYELESQEGKQGRREAEPQHCKKILICRMQEHITGFSIMDSHHHRGTKNGQAVEDRFCQFFELHIKITEEIIAWSGN